MNETANSGRTTLPTRLVAANAALLALLAVLTIAGMQTPAGAQPAGGGGAGTRGRGDYTLISGRFQGGTASAVYVIDGANQEILALTWDRTKNAFEPVGVRSMFSDGQRQSPAR